MAASSDFIHCLEEDMTFKILTCLDTPLDLVRASCVSQLWRRFVITNSLCKGLCLRMFPQLSGVDHVTEPPNFKRRAFEVGPSNLVELKNLEREHRVYAFLSHFYSSIEDKECISEAISASSTDNYPVEGIHNTLEMEDQVGRMASYWSSKGHRNPAAPETLIYKLSSDLCVVTEIGIKPFKAYFQMGYPIYSANSVRFRMGHQKTSMGVEGNLMDQASHDSPDENFEWTYTSPEFSMVQDNQLQKFKLPEPVLCIGGILLVELLGRVQRQEMDGLLYICIAHVQVLGRPLSPLFGVEPLKPPGKFILKVNSYCPPQNTDTLAEPPSVPNDSLQIRVQQLEHLLHILQGNQIVFEEPLVEVPEPEQETSDEEEPL